MKEQLSIDPRGRFFSGSERILTGSLLVTSRREAARPSARALLNGIAGEAQPKPLNPRQWLYGYGVAQGSAVAADSFILLVGSALMAMTPAAVGLLDAVGSIGFILTALVFSFCLPRLRGTPTVFLVSLVALGLTLISFTAINGVIPTLVLATAFGIFLAPSAVLAPILACQDLEPARHTAALGHLNRVSMLGAAAGIGATILWLVVSDLFVAHEVALRTLFIVLGIAAILGALHSYLALLFANLRQHVGVGRLPSPRSSAPQPQPGASLPRLQVPFRLPLLTDQLASYLALTFLLSIAFGMSFSGVHPFFVSGLKAPVAVAMAAILGFRFASFAISRWMSRGIATLFPERAICLTSLVRGVALLPLALASFALPYAFALPLILLSVTLWGISAGALAVAGPVAAARFAFPGRWRQSIALYVAISNGGALLGAWIGGLLSSAFGFGPMFLLAALLTAFASLLMLRT